MASMSSMYMILGLFAIVALLLSIEWLFYSMLLLIGVLMAANSLSPSYSHHPAPSHSGSSHKAHSSEQPRPANFFDVLLANLISGQYHRQRVKHEKHKEHAQHEKHQNEEKVKEKEEHKHELEETKKHLEVQLKKIEDKLYNTNITGSPSVVKELQEQRKLLKEKLDAVIRRL